MDLHKGYNHTVQYYETDKMGITHHSNYIRWMEKADGTCVCVAHSEHCFVDPDGRPINLKKKYPEFYEAIISRKQQLLS